MGATVFYLLMLQKYISSKQKILKFKEYPLCLGNISGDFSANKMKTTRLNGCVYNFSDYRAFDTSNIIDINKYLMKKHNVNDVWVY